MRYVPREDWGATPSTKGWTWLKPKRVEGIVIHHSGVHNGPTGADAVRAFERHHMQVRKWSSIAYNWLVDVDGTIYEGRKMGAVGGATKNWNFKTEAVSYIGDGFEELSLQAQEGVRAVIDHLQLHYGGGLWVKGHRDLAATSCPGDWLYDWSSTGAHHVAPAGGVTPTVDWDALIAYFRAISSMLAVSPLKRRSRGQGVRILQGALPRFGFDPGPADGIFGWRTKRAVKAFQQSRGFLKVNGVVDKKTWDALFFM